MFFGGVGRKNMGGLRWGGVVCGGVGLKVGKEEGEKNSRFCLGVFCLAFYWMRWDSRDDLMTTFVICVV